jgi:hypothetical protein
MSILATPMLVDGRSAAAAAIAKPSRTQDAVFMDRCAIGRTKAHEEKREVANPLTVLYRLIVLYLSWIIPIISCP